jgi:hypothetical protein
MFKYNKINKNDKIIKIKVLIEPKLNRYGYIEIGFVYNEINAWLVYKYSNWFYCKFLSYSSLLDTISKMPDYNDGNDNSFDKFVKYIMDNWNSGKYINRSSDLNKEINKYF